MQEQGSPFLSTSDSILMAAGPQDEQAEALVQALRKTGLRVIFAQTAALALWASDSTACIVVLRPDTWKTPAIATVLRAKPAYLIPILAEPMDLPHGPWTHEAISLGNAPEQTAQAILQVIRAYLATRPASTLSSTGKDAFVAPLKFKQRRRSIGRPFFTALLVLLIIGLAAALGYRYTTHPAQGQNGNPQVNLSTAPPQVVYTAQAPGQNCDTGSGDWSIGVRYKKDKNTEVIDKFTEQQCQSHGTLLTRTGDYGVFSEIFFNGTSSFTTLSQHYRAQVDATIVAGDENADLTMDVHIDTASYARYGFNINTLGRWEANTASPVDGSPINRLAIGFLPHASKTYTLAAEMDGPVMTFFINGAPVTTVTDTTYTANDSLAFGIADNTAAQPISALFSNFQYKELAPSTLTTPQMLATATVQAQANMQTSYTAHIPGYGCDQGTGQWQPLADRRVDTGNLQCLPNGMQLTYPGNTRFIQEEDFYWLNGHFPQNYQVSASIDVRNAGGSCAGLGTRMNPEDEQFGSYVFIICPDGSWQIALVTNSFQNLAEGQVNAQNVYTITATANGSSQSLSINGRLITTITNSQLKNTDHLSLLVGLYTTDKSASATFSNFVFTPLP